MPPIVGRFNVALLFTALLLLGCTPQAGGPNPGGGVPSGASAQRPVVIVDSFGVSSLDPVSEGWSLVKWGMGEMLTRVNSKGELEPWLASGWRSLDPLRWEIVLRDGVTFWDGTVADAAAVKAALERSAAKNAGAREQLGAAAIDVVDARTLVIRTQRPNTALPAALAQWGFVIYNARAVEAQGDQAFTRAPVLTGPFRPVEFKQDELTTLVRHEAYWGGTPALERIQVRLVMDGNTRVLALLSGDADLIMNIPADLLGTLRRQQGVYLTETLGGAVQFLFLNPRTPPLDDPLVRRALSLAVDRRVLAEQVLGGTVEVAGDVYSPIYSWALKLAYPSDVAQAARLLDEAGWRPGADGVRTKDGRPLSFTVLWYPQRTDLQPMGIALQAQLKTLGVRIELKMVEQINAALKTPDWGGALYYNNTAPGGDPQYLLDTFVKSGGVTNVGYASPEMDRLVEQVHSTVERGERARLVRQVQDTLADQAVLIPLVAKKEIFAANERLRNVQPHPVSVYVIDAAFGR